MAKKKNETSADKKKEAAASTAGKQSLHNLYNECNSHLRVLEFYKQEVKYLQKRLEEVVKKNTNKDIMAEAEQFQNQFLLTRENLDELNHTIKTQLKVIEKAIAKKPTHADEKTVSGGDKFSKNVHDLEKDIASIKLRFNKFLSKYL
jgi:hypothetical protein